MPHAQYHDPYLLCPWSGCGYLIELVDFRVEDLGDPPLYKRVMASWGWNADYGLVAMCPGCRQNVLYRPLSKVAVAEISGLACDLLPDNWHLHAAFP